VRRLLRTGFLVLALGLLVLALARSGDEALDAVRDVGAASAAASLLAVLVGLLASSQTWRVLLRELGVALPLRAGLHVFFVGQLGKYVPGSVFAVAAQMELGRAHGASRTRVGTAALVFMGVGLAAGLLVAAVALPLTSPAALRSYGWVLAALPLGLLLLAPPVLTRLVAVLLRLLRRPPLDAPLSWPGVSAAVGWALVMWSAYGVHLWLLVRPQDTSGRADLLLLSLGGYALAWTAGFLVVVAPAGAGVREAALVAALAPVLAAPAALAVAVLSRVLMTLGDLAWGLAGLLLSRSGAGQDGAGVATVTPLQQLGKAADA
jgi:glycosyltransferase 2 family protein